MRRIRETPPVVLAVLALLAAGVFVSVVVDTSDDGHGHKTRTVRIGVGKATIVDGPDADTKRDDTLKLSKPAQQLVKRAEKAPDDFDLGGDLRGPDRTAAGVIHGPLASQEWPGCKTAFVKTFSQRTRSIKAIALHYTAGGELVGWADINGLTAFSNNIGNQVSWHFSIDREGHCAYNVPLNQKAWTISGLNSETVNIEGVGRGTEPNYLDTLGFKRMEQVVWRIARIEHIPLRLGATDGHCNVTKPGIVTHWMGGPCSGGHVDIRPYDIRQVVARIADDAKPSPVIAARRSHRIVHAKIAKRCRGRNRHTPGCALLFKRNGQLHAKYGKAL